MSHILVMYRRSGMPDCHLRINSEGIIKNGVVPLKAISLDDLGVNPNEMHVWCANVYQGPYSSFNDALGLTEGRERMKKLYDLTFSSLEQSVVLSLSKHKQRMIGIQDEIANLYKQLDYEAQRSCLEYLHKV